MKNVNKAFRKKDAMQLVTGKPVYMDDLAPADCLIVKLYRSPHANAMVERIDTSVAKKVPGIEAIFTWEDVDQNARRYTQAGQTYPEASPYDRLVIDRHVRFVGDVVAIVVGKDEKCVVALTPNPVFFLQFGAKEIKRISFAASFGDGNDFFKDRYISKVTPYLNKFDMVTVREYKALDVCKKAGINGCILFPDPTLLIDMSNYNRLLFSNLSTDKYCLVYMLEGEEKTKMSMDDIVAFVKDMGAKMIYVASQGRFDKYAKQYPTIPQFLSYIKNADFVITNSFHGTVFSIMYHRRFVVIPKKNGNNTRIETLLSQYGLQQHIVEEPAMIKNAYNDVVDWTLVDNINEKKKKETVDLLQRVIGGK